MEKEVRAQKTDQEHLIEFLFRSKWNVVGILGGFGSSCMILEFIEPVRLKLVCAVPAFVRIFFGFMAVGLLKEYREENEGT